MYCAMNTSKVCGCFQGLLKFSNDTETWHDLPGDKCLEVFRNFFTE